MKRLALVILGLSFNAFAGQSVDYQSDGVELEGYYAQAQGTPKGSVILIHDWDGLTEYEQKRVNMLSEMGYNAFAVDLYGKGNRPVDTNAKKAETGKLYKDREKMRTLIIAGLDKAREMGVEEVVVAGYCFGGAATLELARSGKAAGVNGYATFHGGLKTPAQQSYPENTAPIFIAHGGADTGIPMTDVADLSVQLETAKVPYLIEVYSGAPHAFTVFESPRYREAADTRSWATFGTFLDQNF
ncbi:dienelactone hydrolase [Enterovibrio norvegicus FF-454]|uniref:Dienelactone hydrolase n=1 Tax=Enterovibrio norvegicus FF-454 TaxID=1185651 RepID=A0A1E5C2M1_9GAMM|nr:dienelactone hydrolase family protein [Enterovibrio norvegicus]OEE59721.1 dienelactone hydrolase [Enterovibrio norvegicus FF-454]